VIDTGELCVLWRGIVDPSVPSVTLRIGKAGITARACPSCAAKGRDAVIRGARAYLRGRFPKIFTALGAVLAVTRAE
jgi:hypothetical protein